MNEKKKKPKLPSDWLELIGEEFEKPYMEELKGFLKAEKKLYDIYPPGNEIFKALETTLPHNIKVVIIGQDPYHGPNQANGLCFSVSHGIKHPPSLKNIFKELGNDINMPYPESGDLTPWAKQGVLLLNATLTVRKSTPGSHQKKGWEQFTDALINKIDEEYTGIVFLLWGKYAQNKAIHITNEKHHLLKAAHPSPFSAHNGFFGSKHFSKANSLLIKQGKSAINWTIS